MAISIDEIKQVIDLLAVPVGTILTAWVALNSLVGRIDERIKMLQVSFSVVERTMPQLGVDIARLDTRMDNLLDRVTTLDRREDTEREKIDGRLRHVETAFAYLGEHKHV